MATARANCRLAAEGGAVKARFMEVSNLSRSRIGAKMEGTSQYPEEASDKDTGGILRLSTQIP
jgi:hypothetical protein